MTYIFIYPPEETVSSTNDSVVPTASNNRTNGSAIHVATQTMKYVNTTQNSTTKPQTSPTHKSETTVKATSPIQTRVIKSDLPGVDDSSPAPQVGTKAYTEVLCVSLGLVIGVLAVGIVIAVLFVRWKR